MDPWNPWIAETYVKRVPYWRVLLADGAIVFSIVLGGWALVVFLLQLDKFAPWLVR